jgi:hypothetical protein
VVDGLQGLLDVLRALARDPEVRLVRVKNRMDPAWDAAPAGGYRAVMVNLCLATAATARLGVDGHVCELQVRVCLCGWYILSCIPAVTCASCRCVGSFHPSESISLPAYAQANDDDDDEEEEEDKREGGRKGGKGREGGGCTYPIMSRCCCWGWRR